jgi:hypothetical protein
VAVVLWFLPSVGSRKALEAHERPQAVLCTAGLCLQGSIGGRLLQRNPALSDRMLRCSAATALGPFMHAPALSCVCFATLACAGALLCLLASKQISTSAWHRSRSAVPGTWRSSSIGRFAFSRPGARRSLALILACHACTACSRLSLIACLLVCLFARGFVCLVVAWHICRPVLHIMIA